jgi:hypothetical protein
MWAHGSFTFIGPKEEARKNRASLLETRSRSAASTPLCRAAPTRLVEQIRSALTGKKESPAMNRA